jgi:hypothetical protein
LHNLIVYHPHISLSAECIAKKHHWSKTAQAFIHLIPSGDYQGILETLVTPVEIGEYLSYRQSLIENWGESALVKVSEKAVVGHYLRNLSELEPTSEFEVLVDKLEQQDPDKVWSLAPIINRYLERRNTPDCLASAENGEERSSVNIDGEDACEKNESTTRQKKRSAS